MRAETRVILNNSFSENDKKEFKEQSDIKIIESIMKRNKGYEFIELNILLRLYMCDRFT